MAELKQDLDKGAYSSNSNRFVGSGPTQGNWTNVTANDSTVFDNPCSFYVIEGGVVSFRNAGNGENFTSSVNIPSGTFLPCMADKLLTSTTATVIAIHSGSLTE